jgi:hypothetical protein
MEKSLYFLYGLSEFLYAIKILFVWVGLLSPIEPSKHPLGGSPEPSGEGTDAQESVGELAEPSGGYGRGEEFS